MRHDATFDRRQIRCPEASTIAYGQWKARVGDWCTWDVHGADGSVVDRPIGRMIGRVAYAPALTGDAGPIRDYLLILQLSDEHTCVFERWVNPADVRRVWRNHPDIGAFLTWFATFDPKSEPIDFWRGAANHGSLRANQCDEPPTGCDWSFAAALDRWREVWRRMLQARSEAR